VTWTFYLSIVVVVAVVVGAACWLIAICFPVVEEGNRPAPPSLRAAAEDARLATLARIAARQRRGR
jgi:hypothetical protein